MGKRTAHTTYSAGSSDGDTPTDWTKFSLVDADIIPFEAAKLDAATTERHETQQVKRGRYFVKGPIPFAWVCENIPDPTSRLILVAKAFMDMEQKSECALSRKVWACAGVYNKDQRRRVLQKIRTAIGGYTVLNRKGRPSVLRRSDPER